MPKIFSCFFTPALDKHTKIMYNTGVLNIGSRNMKPVFYTRIDKAALATLKLYYNESSTSAAISRACEDMAELLVQQDLGRRPTNEEIKTLVRTKQETDTSDLPDLDLDILQVLEELEK